MSDPQSNPRTSESRGLVIVISGPSGVGKTTITRDVTERFDAAFSVSATTRPKTDADVEGRDYFFLTNEEFELQLEAGEFLEHARVFDYYYGTPRQPIIEARDQGKVVILEIDVQGALQVRQTLPDALMIFVLPPSEEVLLERLRKRQRESEDVIARRFSEAKNEIRIARESDAYDIFIVNEKLEEAIDEACVAIREARSSSPSSS